MRRPTGTPSVLIGQDFSKETKRINFGHELLAEGGPIGPTLSSHGRVFFNFF